MWRASALLAVIAVPGVAAAQQNEQSAREAFERGERAFERELYTEAEDAFRQSYDLYGSERRALILFNLATVVEAQGGRDEEALDLWRQFRREANAVAAADQLVHADDRIRELEARIARRRAGGASESIHPLGPVLLGVGGAALVAGVIVGAVSLDRDAAFRERCEDLSMCPAELEGEYEEMRALSAAADVLWVAGGIVAAAGVVLTIVLREGAEGPTTISCGLGGCTLGGRF